MNPVPSHWIDRSGPAASVGLFVAMLVAGIAMMPAEWFIASLILVVLAMPAILLVEPSLERTCRKPDLPKS